VSGVSVRFDIAFPISKVDAERRVVGGWATTEALDRQGDIIPFDVARQAFARFAERSGAVREMHQPRAVGRLEAWRPDPERRGVWAEVYLSRSRDGEDALTKVLEGVLKGFSIGGYATSWDYTEAEGRTVRVFRDIEIYELSLVDVPANPEARIAVVKLADPVAGEAVETVTPAEADPQEVADPLGGKPPSEPDPTRRLRSDPAGNAGPMASPFAPTPPNEKVLKAEKDGERERLRAAQRERARRYRIAPKPSGHLTPPKGYPEDPDQYGDPVNYAYPVDRTRWRAAIAYFNQTEHKRQGGYTDREWGVIGRRIAQLVSRLTGREYVYDPRDQKVKAKEEKLMSEAVEKRDVTMLVESLRSLIQSALSAVDEGDAEAVRDRLSQAAAALEVAVDEVSDLEESAESVESAVITKPSTPSTPSQVSPRTRTRDESLRSPSRAETVSPVTVPTTAHDTESPTVSVPTATRSGTPSSPTVSKAELKDLIREALAEFLASGRPAAPPPAQAAVPRPQGEGFSPVQKALLEGDLSRAVREAGSEAAVYEEAHNGARMMLRKIFRLYLPAPVVADVLGEL
jgi:HK97 family phage prohead protease